MVSGDRPTANKLHGRSDGFWILRFSTKTNEETLINQIKNDVYL